MMMACFIYVLFVCLGLLIEGIAEIKERLCVRWDLEIRGGKVPEKPSCKINFREGDTRNTEQIAMPPEPGNIKEKVIWKGIK